MLIFEQIVEKYHFPGIFFIEKTLKLHLDRKNKNCELFGLSKIVVTFTELFKACHIQVL
jgi:hypothetical protein